MLLYLSIFFYVSVLYLNLFLSSNIFYIYIYMYLHLLSFAAYILHLSRQIALFQLAISIQLVCIVRVIIMLVNIIRRD